MAKTWLVTGTSSGFGKELATLLAKSPEVNLVATARRTEKLDYLDQYDHGQILKLKLDTTDDDDIQNAVNEAVKKFGTIDVLDNNAGLGYFSTFEEAQDVDVKHMFDVNVFGLAHMTQAVLPIMRKQKSGVIIGLSSVCGLAGVPSLSFYCATKFAVEGMYQTLSAEVAEDGIKVMLVEPSAFRTDWSGRSSNKTNTAYPDDYKLVKESMEATEKGQGKEAGDPKKAAKAIYEQVTDNFDHLPLHLPLGAAAVQGATANLKSILSDIDKYSDLAKDADFK
ncbi:oxidoreductase [Eupransor demetentiae]|uniref:NADP-dependent 3-hydroxy acid dehydrogenase YdfG (YdfG) n=1 Tax=Eupransor demetentiae TaxID=3109584 RepID=A0ABM9N687_9LACO|nr:NADP-dependent 3-hydroxy acid dehydrogenase YdfG (YdfG) [Lactobacillaceae bacterium LMG 33000]